MNLEKIQRKIQVYQGSMLRMRLLESIMFANDMNFLYTHKNTNLLLRTVNPELESDNERFKVNKRSLNTGETMIILYREPRAHDNISL